MSRIICRNGIYEISYTDEPDDDIEAYTEPEPLPVHSAAELLEQPAPPRRWVVEDWIPDRQVTLLVGPGGSGKSTLALQLALCAACGVPWLGMPVDRRQALYISSEDELEETHFRLERMLPRVVMEGKDHPDLNGLGICSLSEAEAAELAVFDRRAWELVETPLMERLNDMLGTSRTGLVVLDVLSDLFGGDEVDRGQVSRFVRMLRSLCVKNDCALVTLAHPSVSSSKTKGASGSSGWSGKVRSMMYFDHYKADESEENSTKAEGQDDMRCLSLEKANRARKGQEVAVRWFDNSFSTEWRDKPADNPLADQVLFKMLLRELNAAGRTVSESSGRNYAPPIMANMPGAHGASPGKLALAMKQLLKSGEIKTVMVGPESRQKQSLVVVGGGGGGDLQGSNAPSNGVRTPFERNL